MLSYRELFKDLNFTDNIINNLDILSSRKVLNLNPYKDNNSNEYLKSELKSDETYNVSLTISSKLNCETYLLGIQDNNNNIYHCILSILDDEYITNTKNIQNKDAEFLRLKLISDIDEKYSNIKYIKEFKKIINNEILVNNNIFLYLSIYFKMNFYILDNSKLLKYGNDYEKIIILERRESYYFPVINKNTRYFEKSDIEELDKSSIFVDSIVNKNQYNTMKLSEIQNIALDKGISIVKKNKKGDKDINKTKKELIIEIAP
jgi:hypothetical protein